MEESMTSFSDLPEKLVRRILFSYWTPTNPLTDREKARLSVVSTQFYDLMRNPPVLVWKSGMYDISKDLEDSLSTLTRYEEENIQLDSLTMKASYPNLWVNSDADVMDECIKLGVRKRLTNLHLTLWTYHRVLPQAVFEVESLEKLHLCMCHLKPDRIPVWPNLRELVLHDLRMSNEVVFETLIKGCPSIENLVIDRCHKEYQEKQKFHFKVSNLPNLKKLDATLASNSTIEVCECAAINLESIHCKPDSRTYRQAIILGKHAYPNLKRLDLHKARVLKDQVLNNFGCRFPRLEYLSMGPCFATPRINLCSSSLKELCLYVNEDVLEEACFDVPNLVSFKYRHKCPTTTAQYPTFQSTTTLPKLLFTDRSGKGRPEIEPEEGLDDVQKKLFSRLNMPFEASIRLKRMKEVKFLNQDKYWIKDLPPPGFVTGIRKFTITHICCQCFSLSVAREILDAIFMIYRPQTITFIYAKHRYDDERDCVNHDVKCPLDAVRSSPSNDILKLLQPHENMKTGFTAVFNLEYYRRIKRRKSIS